MKNFKAKNLLFFSLIPLVAFYVLTEPSFFFINKSKFKPYESGLFEPAAYFFVGVLIASIILLCFSEVIFKKWLRSIALWYFPIGFMVILSGSTGSSYAWISRGDLAALVGAVLVIITLVFAITQRFYYKQA